MGNYKYKYHPNDDENDYRIGTFYRGRDTITMFAT